jgi:hypothetical protein
MSLERAGAVWTRQPATREDTASEGSRSTERDGAK